MGVDGLSNQVGAGKRSSKRARVLLAATLRTSNGELSVRLRDLSHSGALIESPQSVPSGEEVVFVRGSTIVPARVAWSSGQRIGLEFLHPIDETEVLVHVSKTAHRPSEKFRRPRILSEDMTDQERNLVRLWGVNVGISVGEG